MLLCALYAIIKQKKTPSREGGDMQRRNGMEKLYNNIELADGFTLVPSDASHVPYLENPPEVIDISVGRQLFVDDFLIEKTEKK